MAMPVRAMSSRAVQAEQTRAQIVQSAERLFADIGYEATSIQMIADELGLTKAAVYYHFRAKIDILNAAMQPGVERIATLLDEAAAMRGRRQRIEHVAAGVVDFLVRTRHYSVMAASDLSGRQKSMDKDAHITMLRRRALTLFFGEHPTPAERASFIAAFSIPYQLPDLVDLTDEELREALQATMLRILRVPA